MSRFVFSSLPFPPKPLSSEINLRKRCTIQYLRSFTAVNRYNGYVLPISSLEKNSEGIEGASGDLVADKY
jgi:hypothetical protein